MITSISKNLKSKIFLFATIVAIITLRDGDATVDPGIDAPFRWALNYFLAFDKAKLAHLQYTVGPLCILKWPVPIGDHILISTLYYLFIAGIFSYLCTLFYCQYRQSNQVVVPLLASTVFLLVANIDVVLLGCVLLGMLFFALLKRQKYLFTGLLLTVAGIYIKTSLLVITGSAWLPFIIYLLAKKHYKYLLQLFATGLLLFLIFGFLLLGSAVSLLNFAYYNILFAWKYSDMLSLYPDNNWYLLTGCLLCIALSYIFYIRRSGGFVLGLCSLCLFSLWKYSMGREDFFHAQAFGNFLLLLVILFALVQEKSGHWGTMLLLGALCFYNTNLQNTVRYSYRYFAPPSFINFNERVLHQRKFKQDMLEASRQSCAVNKLPEAWKAIIGKQSVDVFPWDLSILMINDLNYEPRPSLQSIGLNKENDHSDSSFIASAKGPEYVVWHTTEGDQTKIDGIDNQYLPNTCPATTEALLSQYQPSNMSNEHFSTWQKRSMALQVREVVNKTAGATWGEWIALRACDSNSLVKVKVAYKSTKAFALRQLVFKGTPMYIDYEGDSGKIYHYRFSEQLGKAGLFAGPLLYDNQLHFKNIKRIRFVTDRQDFFKPQLDLAFSIVTIKGLNTSSKN